MCAFCMVARKWSDSNPVGEGVADVCGDDDEGEAREAGADEVADECRPAAVRCSECNPVLHSHRLCADRSTARWTRQTHQRFGGGTGTCFALWWLSCHSVSTQSPGRQVKFLLFSFTDLIVCWLVAWCSGNAMRLVWSVSLLIVNIGIGD